MAEPAPIPDDVIQCGCGTTQSTNDGAYKTHSGGTAIGDGSNSLLGKINKRLLVVDDDDVDRERIYRYIKKFNLPLAVLDASSGSDALQRIMAEEVDLVLLDYQLGDMTGIELLSRLKQDNHSVPTIMITGMGDEKAVMEALRLGVFDYLTKGNLTPESLQKALESVLRADELEQELQNYQQKLEQLSLYDSLTKLPNRNLLFDRTQQAIAIAQREETSFALVMIDLNLFKEINDTMGHEAGDHALKIVAERLNTCVRKSDTVARLGGDEFVCILRNIDDPGIIESCTEKILKVIEQPLLINGRLMKLGASLGVARYPEHGHDTSKLLSSADRAMYKAKKSLRSIVHVDELDERSNSVSLSQLLYEALSRNSEIYLEYQPKLNLVSNRVVGVEAVVRWRSAALGKVPTEDFIRIAEKSTLIQKLTKYVVSNALAQMSSWQHTEMLPLSLNVSARDLDDETFPEWLLQQTELHAVSPASIFLEVSEPALPERDSSTASRVMRKLTAYGFKISIDNFGKGYTSFQVLRDIYVNEIKIDHSLVKRIHSHSRDRAIVSALIQLARNLEVNAVVAGVETEEQLSTLKQLGCPCVQGYYFAKPMRLTRLRRWLRQ